MASLANIINEIMNEKMKSVHVAFLAQILSVNDNKAKIQPLGLTRQYGGTAQKQAVITGVHISQSARYKFKMKDLAYDLNNATKTQTIVEPTPIEVGDIVLCVCCDRNIDAALKGKNELPPIGSHNKSDCVIVSII